MPRRISLILLASLLPLLLVLTAAGGWALARQRAAMDREAESVARLAALLVDQELDGSKRAVGMVSQSPLFDEGLDESRFRELAGRLIADLPQWRFLSVSDPDGRRLLDVPAPISGLPGGQVVDLDSHARAVASGRITVGGLVVGPRGTGGFAVRAPVRRRGRTPYVVSAVVRPASIARLVEVADVPPGWRIEVRDRAGAIVATHGAPVQAAVAGGLRRTARLPDSGWAVDVLAPAWAYNRPLLHAAVVVIVGLLGALVAGLLLRRQLARELQAQRARDAALVEHQRLEALGRLVGGVAHDFNNLLTPIVGGLDLLKKRLPADARTSRLLDAAVVSADRARTLAGRLLTFARQQTLEARLTLLEPLLDGLAEIVRGTVGGGVAVRITTAPQLPPLHVDPHQLELAILNLAVNSRDAMPGGGEISITARRETADGRAWVVISVSDTGDGMDAATLARAAEPFFSTKGVGKGTGLGLSMAHGFAHQSGGRLELTSAPGCGTTAEIWLPAAAAGETGDPAPEPSGPPPVRPARVLVLDDDPLVRATTSSLLAEAHEAVFEADTVSTAMDILQRETIDLVLTDYALVGETGLDLVRAMRSAGHGQPVLLVTGFADPLEGVPDDIERLNKPYRQGELLQALGRLLAGADGG